MSQELKADTFDWVSARAECSLAAMFGKLAMEIKSDVEIREELSRRHQDGGTFVVDAAPRGFIVTRTRNRINAQVSFVLKPDVIEISGNGLNVAASQAFVDDGSCVFTVAGQKLKSWQLRHLVLDGLFFGE